MNFINSSCGEQIKVTLKLLPLPAEIQNNGVKTTQIFTLPGILC